MVRNRFLAADGRTKLSRRMVESRRADIRGEGRKRLEDAIAWCHSQYGLATVEMVCSKAEASIGTFYHHFPNGLNEMRGTVYLDARIESQESLLRELASHRSLKRGIESAIGFHFNWIAGHQLHAACLLYSDANWLNHEHRAILTCATDELKQQADDWYRAHVASGQARDLPHFVYWALIFGPADMAARHFLSRVDTRDVPAELRRAVPTLATGGWLSVARK
jgi:AcrR family transcriptional regulator